MGKSDVVTEGGIDRNRQWEIDIGRERELCVTVCMPTPNAPCSVALRPPTHSFSLIPLS